MLEQLVNRMLGKILKSKHLVQKKQVFLSVKPNYSCTHTNVIFRSRI